MFNRSSLFGLRVVYHKFKQGIKPVFVLAHDDSQNRFIFCINELLLDIIYYILISEKERRRPNK